MLMIVGLGLVVNSVWSSSGILGVKSDFSNAALLSATNDNRTRDHEPALAINAQLTAAAQTKANDMVSRNYWSHDTPDGKTPWNFITAAGYQYQSAGENLAYGFDNASGAVAGWMNSPKHRANILDTNYRNVGFGVASSPNYQGRGPETVIVAEYGQPVGTPASVAPNAQSAVVEGASAQPVSRIQLLTGGQAAWSALAVSALAGAAFALFIVRNGLRLRRLVLEGESFVAHHPLLDIAIVFVFTAGFVMTRVGGIIS
ncbi:MAG TPA: CAP domain-containing protein [Candidatus Dormibacteraeota bacterium]|nr:CAP domain-containing protein [Candidatus Dormibacteraeota bacterium]